MKLITQNSRNIFIFTTSSLQNIMLPTYVYRDYHEFRQVSTNLKTSYTTYKLYYNYTITYNASNTFKPIFHKPKDFLDNCFFHKPEFFYCFYQSNLSYVKLLC